MSGGTDPDAVAPPGGDAAAPPGGGASGIGAGQVAGAQLPPLALTAPGRQFLVAGQVPRPQGQSADASPATPDQAGSARPRTPVAASSPSEARNAPLMDRSDWAVLTLVLILFPALLAAMNFESRKSKSRKE